jgi:hypothetical protein
MNTSLKVVLICSQVYLLSGCLSVIHKGVSIKAQPTGEWKLTDYYIGSGETPFGKKILTTCYGKQVWQDARNTKYAAWIGPPLIPFIPAPTPPTRTAFDLFYQHFKDKTISNCPAIRVNQGELQKAYSMGTGGNTCYYGLDIPKKNFTLSFEGGMDGCKLDDLNYKVEPYTSYDPLWMFGG